MKITCDNCAAKYSIADEKVKGKVFKIRCKKCSQIIVVRGTDDDYGAGGREDEGYDAGAAGAGYGEQEAAVWHVVIGRDQVGPMTADEVRDRFAAGEINVESYIWREGFSDWLRLTAVDDFADMGQSTAVAPAAATGWEGQQGAQAGAWAGGAGAEETQRADSAALFGAAGQPESQDLFATGGGDAGYAAPAAGGYEAGYDAPAGGGVFTSSPESAGGGDLFAGAAAGPAADPGGGLFSEDPREQVPSDPSVPVKQMTGQRGENSVLFSLANLQSLAMGDGGASRPAPAAPKAGMASGGGSGLIDIRAMAASASTSGGPAASPRSEESLPPMGGFGGPIAAAPVLMPSSGSDRPGWLLPVVIGGSVVVLGLAITLVLVVALKKDPQPQTQVALNTPGTAGGTATGATLTKDPAKPGTKAGGTTENATGTTPGTAKKSDDTKDDKTDGKGDGKGDRVAGNTGKTKTRRHRGGRRAGRKGTTRRGTTHRPTRVASNTPTPRKKGSGKRDELDDLLDGAMGKKRKRAGSKPKPAAAPPSSNLPDRLERHQIVKGMQGIKPAIKRCFDRFRVPGMAMVRVSIGGGGRVTRAKVTGLFAGTPTGACIGGAVKSARFARTKNATTITYPFNLR